MQIHPHTSVKMPSSDMKTNLKHVPRYFALELKESLVKEDVVQCIHSTKEFVGLWIPDLLQPVSGLATLIFNQA